MRASTASLSHKLVATLAALTLTCSMVPLAWADDVSVGTAASMAAGSMENASEAASGEGPDAQQAPEASHSSTGTKAADSGSTGGTTVSIQVYRSSFPIVKWDLNDDDHALTKAEWSWASRTDELPERGTPGAAIEWTAPADYAEPTRSGFEFAGWSTDKSAPAGGYLDAKPAISMPEGAPESGEYTLYALWTPNEYAVLFELARNPDAAEGPGSDDSFALNWSTEDGVRTVTPLNGGRSYRVDGFTMKGADYDAATRTVKLPEPARTGYRFLGWVEADAASGVVSGGANGYALNPVRLPQIDGTPVLTARWASAFGVTAPLSITFGDYDKTGAPGNPSLGESSNAAASDTTQSEADDVKTPALTDQERYEALGAAYFENTGWADPIKMVAITSERDAAANEVLTTYDSKQATEAAVLGDGTAANPGERLLSLYPAASAPVDKSAGVHFRLSDSLAEDDLAKLPSIAAKTKQPVTYGLNLATDPVDGSANHGLVLETEDYAAKQIATVSYTFATADAGSSDPVPDSFYVSDGGRTYGLAYIKQAADDISAKGSESTYYPLFEGFMKNDAAFQLRIGEDYHSVRIVGLAQDTRSDNGRKAGITFGFTSQYAGERVHFSTHVNIGGSGLSGGEIGWGNLTYPNELRTYLRGEFWNSLPPEVRSEIVPVRKYQQLYGVRFGGGPSSALPSYLQGSTSDTVFLPSMYEVYGAGIDPLNPSEAVTSVSGYRPFQYQYYALAGSGTQTNANAIVSGPSEHWWLRSCSYGDPTDFEWVESKTGYCHDVGCHSKAGVVPFFCL